MRDYLRENLVHDAVHGYIPIGSPVGLPPGEASEREVIDHPWLQRMRCIRQLQTAYWVYPTAEHSRFSHVVGVTHLASRAVGSLYESLRQVCPDTPSRGYVECLLRMAGLLHDVGHGPFGHFLDEHFLKGFGLTHETLGAHVIEHVLGDLIARVRRNPNSALAASERLDPRQVAWLVVRPGAHQPGAHEPDNQPRWLRFLRSLLSGIYTIDNLDFVLRDAYMTGFSPRAFDLERLLHYTFFSERGLTIHDRGVEALVRFMAARADLFRNVYFHRTVRAIDLTLADLFAESREHLFPGNPLEHLDAYLEFTDFALQVDVARWRRHGDPKLRALGARWSELLNRRVRWKMVCQRTRVFEERESEQASVFSEPAMVEKKLRDALPRDLRDAPLRVDIARHLHRPNTRGPADGQNFLYDSARGEVRPLGAHELYRRLPISHRICRVYAESTEHAGAFAAALDTLFGSAGPDDATNM